MTFLLAALAAASIGYWVLKWPAPASTAQLALQDTATPPIDSTKIAQLLGANPSAAGAATQTPTERFQLLGVIAVGSRSGSALIAVDNAPAKPYRVGEPVTDDLLLQSVKARSVTLAANMQSSGGVTLELPPVPGTP
ncbi:type II secretion system protein N [Rhodoferax sp.]|uniref:type II secretion system protein N n=1 Tax=Rhodoferax sp. TaxID=50421 RepID=UPI00345BFFF0